MSALYDIPLEIQRMAKEAQLGELRKVYNASNRSRKEVGTFFVILALMLLHGKSREQTMIENAKMIRYFL
ncbi:MAG: hypothetical protein ABI456_03160 [Ktedonobacteraceae bacterium]|nr:hypothetical protein [Chloroflexota bacterium]